MNRIDEENCEDDGSVDGSKRGAKVYNLVMTEDETEQEIHILVCFFLSKVCVMLLMLPTVVMGSGVLMVVLMIRVISSGNSGFG